MLKGAREEVGVGWQEEYGSEGLAGGKGLFLTAQVLGGPVGSVGVVRGICPSRLVILI